jgi:hypothetical protein
MFDDTGAQLADHRDKLIVTHSVLGTTFANFVSFVAANRERFREDCDRIGLAPDDRSGWARRFLALALRRNPRGVVLFSSSKADHIRAAASAAELPDDELASMPELISEFGAARHQ